MSENRNCEDGQEALERVIMLENLVCALADAVANAVGPDRPEAALRILEAVAELNEP